MSAVRLQVNQHERAKMKAETVLVYGRMLLSVEVINPAIAKRLLEKNTTNRKLRPHLVAQYARDMSNDSWLQKPSAICIDEHGNVGNGQHTLEAIVASGCSQELLVARDVPLPSIAVMDLGIKRTISDVAHFLGADMSGRGASIARIMKWPAGSSKHRSFDELFSAYQEHAPAIEFVLAAAPKKVGFSAPVLAVCARAWYSVDHALLTRFLQILDNGVVADEKETAAIRLRDACWARTSSPGRTTTVETYKKAQSALYAFVSRKPLAKLYSTDSELFPIPPAGASVPK